MDANDESPSGFNNDDDDDWLDLQAEQAAVCFLGLKGWLFWMIIGCFYGYCRQWSKLVVLYLVS